MTLETLEETLSGVEWDLDSQIAMKTVLDNCPPWEITVFKALLQAKGSVTGAARRLRVHPSTVRRAQRRIAEVLKAHGFGRRR